PTPSFSLPHGLAGELPEEAPLPGPLQLQLRTGEFGLLRRIRVFESDFIQVSRRGEVLDVHNRMRVVTVGVARTSPGIPVPNVLLLARPCAPPPAAGVELTRLLPLRWVQVSVQDALREQLRLRFANGRSFYLQLCPCPGTPGLFDRWARLVRVLRPPGEAPPPAPGEALRPVGGVAPEEWCRSTTAARRGPRRRRRCPPGPTASASGGRASWAGREKGRASGGSPPMVTPHRVMVTVVAGAPGRASTTAKASKKVRGRRGAPGHGGAPTRRPLTASPAGGRGPAPIRHCREGDGDRGGSRDRAVGIHLTAARVGHQAHDVPRAPIQREAEGLRHPWRAGNEVGVPISCRGGIAGGQGGAGTPSLAPPPAPSTPLLEEEKVRKVGLAAAAAGRRRLVLAGVGRGPVLCLVPPTPTPMYPRDPRPRRPHPQALQGKGGTVRGGGGSPDTWALSAATGGGGIYLHPPRGLAALWGERRERGVGGLGHEVGARGPQPWGDGITGVLATG
uniref:Golgi associated RAB2 interactor protein-like Rab2B-binding domain-containing protein n=1 Tax=Apteryx owenii TaxID=8824 RepID=A0A8B9PYR8_APTOW